MKELGPEFETAFEAGADLDPDSEDGKAYDAALDKLDAKCGGCASGTTAVAAAARHLLSANRRARR